MCLMMNRAEPVGRSGTPELPDIWTIEEDTITRHHRSWRTSMFTLFQDNCPCDVSCLTLDRETHVSDQKGGEYCIHDEWVGSRSQTHLDQKWKGKAVLFFKRLPQPFVLEPTLESPTDPYLSRALPARSLEQQPSNPSYLPLPITERHIELLGTIPRSRSSRGHGEVSAGHWIRSDWDRSYYSCSRSIRMRSLCRVISRRGLKHSQTMMQH